MPMYISRSDTESYLIEGNPKFNQQLLSLKKHFKSIIRSVELQTVVWTANTNLTFYLDTINTAYSANAVGSSLMDNHQAVLLSNKTHVRAKAIDICWYIINIVKAREDDYVVLKLDIEGTEYEVLPFILKNEKCFFRIDRIVVEFHPKLFNNKVHVYDDRQLTEMFLQVGIDLIRWY